MGREGGKRMSDGVQPNAGQFVEELRPGLGQDALDDAPIVGSMLSFHEAVALHARNEPARCGGTEMEDLGNPAHGLWTPAPEQVQESDLAERQIAGW